MRKRLSNKKVNKENNPLNYNETSNEVLKLNE